jgi:hypothetical protein
VKRKEIAMETKPTLTITLTKEQQLEVLAATGLLVRTLALDPEAPDESGAATASLPLPQWLVEEMAVKYDLNREDTQPW